MTFLQFKKLCANLYRIKFFNFIKILIINGSRNGSSIIIPIGKFNFSIAKNAEINIIQGDFLINSFFSKPDPFFGVLKMKNNSKIAVLDTFTIHSGCNIGLLENAELILGSGYINSNATIRCFKKISIGKNVAISENVTIWDSDAHVIVGKEEEKIQPISIGDHVWIGTNVTILKGVTIGNGCMIAAGAVVNKSIPPNCLAGGVPAKVLKQNIQWK